MFTSYDIFQMNIKKIKKDPKQYKINETKRFGEPDNIDLILEYNERGNKQLYLGEKYNQLKKLLSQQISLNKKNHNHDNSGNDEGKINTNSMNIDIDIMLDGLIGLLSKKNKKKMDNQENKEKTNNSQNEVRKIIENMSTSEMINLSQQIDKKIEKLDFTYFSKRDELINKLGNILDSNVPLSNDEKDNEIIYTYTGKPLNENIEKLYDHADLGEKLGIINSIAGTRVSGHRSYYLLAEGVELSLALINYSLDFIKKYNYVPIQGPHFLNEETMSKVSQLEDFKETLYQINTSEKKDDPVKYSIATAEQFITPYHYNHMFLKEELPEKFVGISPCYRKESGAAGKDVRLPFRVHQFNKVEIFVTTTKDKSQETMVEMIEIIKEFYESLGLSFRIVNIVSGALNLAASKKCDLEGYFVATKQYRELVSCSNVLDYFSKKLNIKDNKHNYVHMLNSTLCADTRTISCILEQYQTNDGIIIPEKLRPYMRKDFIKFKK
jgi:seryl-tRNA synthetase